MREQVLAVDPAGEELTVRHENIRGFMPGMTMPFKVKPGSSGQEVLYNRRTGVIDFDGRLARVLSGCGGTPDELVRAIKDADAIR